jgi:hypothetical protein
MHKGQSVHSVLHVCWHRDSRTSMLKPCYRKTLDWGASMVCFSQNDDKILVSGEDAVAAQVRAHFDWEQYKWINRFAGRFTMC